MKPPQPFGPEFHAKLTEALGFPVPEGTPIEEVLCWLKAKREDVKTALAQQEREKGEVALDDLKLILRKKKRRGHLQQQALDTWDRHYKGKDVVVFVPE